MRLRKNIDPVSDEQGFASIVIALVLIVILALLTVGFAQLARREQQDALDKQLSTEAYYAAESGINDAVKDINSGVINSTNANSTTCMTATGAGSGTQNLNPATTLTATPTVDANNGVSYSCLLVNLSPTNLGFDDAAPGSGASLDFTTNVPTGYALNSLTIQWESHDGHNSAALSSSTYPANAKFPTSAVWNANPNPRPPVLQFSLTPTNSGGTITRNSLINSTFTTYLYPANDGVNSVAYSTASQGQIVPGNCGHNATTYPCSVTITGLSAIGTSFVLHYLDFYDASDVYVTGTSTAPGNPGVTFTGQVQIDVTGKAQNVLRRLQETLDADGHNGTITNPPLLPDNALQAQNICKRLQTRPGTTDFINPTGGTVDPPTVDACDLGN